MAASGNKGSSILENEEGDCSCSSKLANKMDDPIPINHISIGQALDMGIVNQYGQLLGEYSRLDDELWLSKPDADEVVERCNEVLDWDSVPTYENIVDQGQLSECVENSVCDVGMTSLKEQPSSAKDCPWDPHKTSSPVSVLKKRSCSNVRTPASSYSNFGQSVKRNSSGGHSFLGSTSPVRQQSRACQSGSETSMESSLSDETEEYIPAKQVRTRKLTDLLGLESDPAAKKCMHCATTETPQWRTGPMGRKTLCNACGVQYKHGRLFPDYRPLRSPTFNPSLHTNLPKKVQEKKMGSTSERGPNPTPEPKKVGEMRTGNISEMGKNLASKPVIFEEISMGENSDIRWNLTSEPEKFEMGSSNKNKMGQNRAHRAMDFQVIRDKASNFVQSDRREKNLKFDSKAILKPKLATKVVKRCLHCESTKTPQWREGPMGRNTLCNACGVQYRFGRLYPEYRPLKSPTYDPSLHSHLPKKVRQMRMNNAENYATSGNCEETA